MANMGTDENTKWTLGALSNVDGSTIVPLWADPVTHRLLVDIASSSGIIVGTTTIASGTDKGILYDNAGVVGIYTPSASEILATDASKNVISLDTATYPSLTELSYVKGVTSAIQTQINAKGTGTVTAVSVVSANGFAGTVATSTTTPAITLSTSITGILQGNGTAISAITIGSGLTFSGGTLSATGGGIQALTINISSAQILALHTTAVELVPAPGAGKIIVVNQLVWNLTVGTPYSGIDNVEVAYNGATSPSLYEISSSDVFTSTTNKIFQTIPYAGKILTGSDNKNLTIKGYGGSPYTGGTGTLKIYIEYMIITL